MLTVDEVTRAYDEGDLTRSELFARLVMLLSPATSGAIRARLGAEPDLLDAFEGWLDDITRGAEVLSGKHVVPITSEIRSAIASWHLRADEDAHAGPQEAQRRSQEARYMELAERMARWMAEDHRGEPTFDADGIEPITLVNAA